MVDAIKQSTSLVKKVYTREHHISEWVCSTGQIFDRTYRFESCPDYIFFDKCFVNSKNWLIFVSRFDIYK
jgi:hypothetical protein